MIPEFDHKPDPFADFLLIALIIVAAVTIFLNLNFQLGEQF